MGNNSRRVEKGKALAPPPPAGDKEEERRVLEEKLHRTRLELQRMLALSADADETISKLIAEAQRVKKERDEEYVKFKMLQAELRARRNTQAQAMMMATGGYGNHRALLVAAPFGTQEQYFTGASYCFAPSSPHTLRQASFDPDMFPTNAAGGDSVVPTMATGSGQLVSELGLVAEQILRFPWKNEEVVEAPVRQEEEEEDKTDADTSVADDKDE